MSDAFLTYARLFYEFFKTGLFSIGGGMATFPFLMDMGATTGWFSSEELMNMLAVSESTPGPIGINMATYVGFTVGSQFGVFGSILGGVIATLGEVTPSIIVILLIAMALKKFRSNPYVERAFYGLRPASAGLITAATIGIIVSVMWYGNDIKQLISGAQVQLFVPGLIFGAVLFILMNFVKFTKKIHPVFYVLVSAIVGILLKW